MTNLIEFTLKSEKGERHIAICPVQFQVIQRPSLAPPFKAYIYEDLAMEEWSAHVGQQKNSMPPASPKEMQVLKRDQDFEKAYLGYVVKPNENEPWQNDGNLKRLSADEIKQLEQLINNYRRPTPD